jgi:hypothetical protein
MLTDIRNITKFPLQIAAASCLVDTAGLFIWRFYATKDGATNTWYDKFGLAAYGADILSIMLGIVLAQLITTAIGGPWNPMFFIGVTVAIQVVHDLLFGAVIVPIVPKGQNEMMDLMKTYAKESGFGIVVVDAIYMILTSLLVMYFASLDQSISWFVLLATLYTTMYILYTKSPLPP